MGFNLTYRVYNEQSVLVSWPEKMDRAILWDILNFKKRVQHHYIKQKIELIHAYSSLLIIYDQTIDDVNGVFSLLSDIYQSQSDGTITSPTTWLFPVCYHEHLAPDLIPMIGRKNCSISELIAWHSAPLYTIYFIGFLPGFMYLGGMDKRLITERKKHPDAQIPKGAVAIGGQQTGIYPQSSPGGWHVIGRTPLQLFNPHGTPPCSFSPGDRLQFQPVTLEAYYDIENQVRQGNYVIKPIL